MIVSARNRNNIGGNNLRWPICLRQCPTSKLTTSIVIQNGPFDAAVICYNDAEYRDFKREDGRPKRWLIFPRAKVIELCPKVAKDLMPVDLRQSP